MLVVYTIQDGEIIGIRDQEEPYTLLENERGSNIRFIKPALVNDVVVEIVTQAEIDAETRLQNRQTKFEVISNGIEITNEGDVFQFSKEELQEFAFYSGVWTGNMNWFDINDEEINLTVARRNQIITVGVEFFVGILNSN